MEYMLKWVHDFFTLIQFRSNHNNWFLLIKNALSLCGLLHVLKKWVFIIKNVLPDLVCRITFNAFVWHIIEQCYCYNHQSPSAVCIDFFFWTTKNSSNTCFFSSNCMYPWHYTYYINIIRRWIILCSFQSFWKRLFFI